MPATKATVRKRTAKKAITKRARPKKKAVARKTVKKDGRSNPSRQMVAMRTTAIRETKKIGVYLEQCRTRPTGRDRAVIAIGGLKGFPAFTDDPDIIERAANALESRLPTMPGAVKALRTQQRILDLRDAAEKMRERTNGDGTTPRDVFVEHGAAWAEKYGIGYRAFRSMGVPAKVLKAAGIS